MSHVSLHVVDVYHFETKKEKWCTAIISSMMCFNGAIMCATTWSQREVYNMKKHQVYNMKVQHWSKETPLPGGVSYLLSSQIKNREEEDPPWRTTPEIDQFWGCFFRERPLPPGSWSGNMVNRKPPRGGVFFRSTWRNMKSAVHDEDTRCSLQKACRQHQVFDLHVYNFMSTTSCLQLHVYNFMSTTSCLQLHVYNFMSTTSSSPARSFKSTTSD